MNATVKNLIVNIAYLLVGLVAVATLWQVSQGQSAKAVVTVEQPVAPMVMVTGSGSGGSVGTTAAVVEAGTVGQGGNVAR